MSDPIGDDLKNILVREASLNDAQLIADLTRASWADKVSPTSSGHRETAEVVLMDLQRGGAFILQVNGVPSFLRLVISARQTSPPRIVCQRSRYTARSWRTAARMAGVRPTASAALNPVMRTKAGLT